MSSSSFASVLVVALGAALPVGAQDIAEPVELMAPVLDSIEFQDRTYFREETLRTFVTHAVGVPLNEAQLKADVNRIEAAFHDRGFLRAAVTLILKPAGAHGVRAIISIDAGERAELKRVKVVGNEKVSESVLKEGFFSRPPEPLGALTRAGLFHRPFLDQDQQRLVANYYRKGFLEAHVVDTRVEAEPGLSGISVTLRVVEGPLYELGGLKFEGETPEGVSVEEMRKVITVKDGDVADLVTIQQQADALLEPLRKEGYPFARFEQAVTMMEPPSKDPTHRAVSLTLRFARGPKPIVKEVRVAGNKGTAERVIRRDIEIKGGHPYDHQSLKATERALMSTGFFSSAQARAVPIKDEPNIVDIEVTVVEQQTWLASIAPGYDESAGGLLGIGVLADRNFLGTGLYVSAFARLSPLKTTFDITLQEPRLLDSHVSLTGEVHRRELNYLGFKVLSEVGGGVRTSIPLGAAFFVGAGLTVDYGGVASYTDQDFGRPVLLLNDPELLPVGVFRNPVSLSFAWDRRDSVLLPRNGIYASASTTYAGPFTLSGVSFLDSDASLRLFWTPVFGITWKSNTSVGAVFDPQGGRVPVTDRYFLGGLGSVRGYLGTTLSPVEALATTTGPQDLPIGGVVRGVQNLEVEFPLWPDTPFRGFGFLDAGNTLSESELVNGPVNRGATLPYGLFMSTGFGFLLETPVLPFRFEWSVPLTPRSFDRGISFFLGIGSAF